MIYLLKENGFSVDDVYFQEIFLGPFVKRIGGRGGPSQPGFGGKARSALKNMAKDIFNSTPLIPELSSKPYRCPPAIGRTGTIGIYVAKPKPYTNV